MSTWPGRTTGPNSGTNPDSIILYNRSRFTAKAGGDVQSDLEDLADATRGWVVPVTTNVEWNNPSIPDQCTALLANAVSGDVHDALLPLLSSTNPVQNVVVIGTDDVLPMRRVQDATGIHDERDYAEQVGGNDAIEDSFATQWFLSDDIYGDPDPIDWLGRQLFLPDAAVGRLVETHDDVQNQITLFLQSSGVLDPQTALTTGYDFLADGADEVDSALSQYTQVPPGDPNPLIDPLGSTTGLWTAAELNAALGQNPDIASLNAHFDHQNLLSSAGNASATQDDVLNIAALAGAFKSQIIFAMGCHSRPQCARQLRR